MLKIAVAGKGGVGKTTLVALLGHVFAAQGRPVVVVDADPDANLASALGFSDVEITPVSKLKELIAERTESGGSFGSFFKMNPEVSDIPEKYSVERGGIRLLVLGTVEKGGGGCICPESAFVKALMNHLVFAEDAAVIMDMEAGIEHLGRATANAVDFMVVVVEPGRRSVQTAVKVKQLAADIGIKRVVAVLNKVRADSEAATLRGLLDSEGIETLGVLPYSEALIAADLKGVSAAEADEAYLESVRQIAEKLAENKR